MVTISNWLQFENNLYQGCVYDYSWGQESLTCLCTAFSPIISVGDTISATDIAGNVWTISTRIENNRLIMSLTIGNSYSKESFIDGVGPNENLLMYCVKTKDNSYLLAFRRLYGYYNGKYWANGACGYNQDIEVLGDDPNRNSFPVGTKFEEIYGYDSAANLAATAVRTRNVVLFMSSSEQYETFFNGRIAIPFEIANAIQTDVDPGEPISNKDPYSDGGTSETGGGGGSFDNTSIPIEIPNLPSISAASTGFISLFNPTLNQLNELASYMWSDLFQVDGWKKLFADPMDAILGLSIVPVAVPSGGTREVKVGNIGTGISLTIASSQFVEVDCGSIDVNECWGAYLDYEPYTQAQIFLPYIGTRPISVDDIMGKTVRVVYHVDILTGACCCFVKCGDSVLYTYNGQCSIPIPITGANYASVVNGVISIAASVGSLVATGGSSAPTAIPAIASSAVNQMKPQIEKSGSISGSAGVLNMQTPYLILIRPRQALPSKQNEFIGYPSLITVKLTELSGYTEVQSIHLENIPATQEELAEIESLLEGGVIF